MASLPKGDGQLGRREAFRRNSPDLKQNFRAHEEEAVDDTYGEGYQHVAGPVIQQESSPESKDHGER